MIHLARVGTLPPREAEAIGGGAIQPHRAASDDGGFY